MSRSTHSVRSSGIGGNGQHLATFVLANAGALEAGDRFFVVDMYGESVSYSRTAVCRAITSNADGAADSQW